VVVAANLVSGAPEISDTGPIAYYVLLLPASLLGGLTIVASLERWPDLAVAALTVHLLLGTGTFFGEHLTRIARLVHAIHGPAEDALGQLEPPALLLVAPTEPERRQGWISGFPEVLRDASLPVIVYPEGPDAEALRARYPDRRCYRLDGRRLGPC
jgi:hypothetical protein